MRSHANAVSRLSLSGQGKRQSSLLESAFGDGRVHTTITSFCEGCQQIGAEIELLLRNPSNSSV